MKKSTKIIPLLLAAVILAASLASCDWGVNPVPEDATSSAAKNYTPHKFGVEDAAAGGVRIGMTEEQVTEILGEPDDKQNVTNDNFPVIYVGSADKVFVTTTNSENNLSVTGTFTADGDTNTDAVIFSKDDIVFNGTGSLTITSAQGNGISGKDDIKFTGGTYNITSKLDSVEANDSIAVYAGNFTINSSKDAFHSEDGDDDTTGYVYMLDGTFNIKASGDSIQATTLVQIDGGTFTLTSSEGIEAT